MITLHEYAYAKINLTLDVLGKRQDGYHDLKSVMQTVSLTDDIEIDMDTGKPWELFCDTEGIPNDSRNHAWKAAEVFYEKTQLETTGIAIRIKKRSPAQAGLGGGSADAGAVLRALNRHYGEPLSVAELAELGSLVGSDVPFCTHCGTMMAEGRGELLREFPAMPDCRFVICKPEFSVSTADLYREIDNAQISERPDHSKMEDALLSGDLIRVAECVCNVFDPVVAENHPEINGIKSVCNACGAAAQQMTGSGSAVFAIAKDEKIAHDIFTALKAQYSCVFIAKPV